MIRTGLEKSGLFCCVVRSFFCMAAVLILLGSVGCVNRVVRKSMALQPEAPEAVVLEAATEDESASEVIGENGGGVGTPPAEVEIQAASEGGDGADILQQTRGAVFASLTTPVGAGPPDSTVQESSEPGTEPGPQDSVASLTGEDSPPADGAGEVAAAGEADKAEAPPAEEAVESSVIADDPASEEVAEASIAEPTPPPAEETPGEEVPAEKPVVSPETEVTRLEPPPSAPAPVASTVAKLTASNPPSGTESGGGANTASVLFLVLGGIGAALILIRRRVRA